MKKELSEDEVSQIYELTLRGESAKSVADEFGISTTVLYKIRKGRLYKDHPECAEYKRDFKKIKKIKSIKHGVLYLNKLGLTTVQISKTFKVTTALVEEVIMDNELTEKIN